MGRYQVPGRIKTAAYTLGGSAIFGLLTALGQTLSADLKSPMSVSVAGILAGAAVLIVMVLSIRDICLKTIERRGLKELRVSSARVLDKTHAVADMTTERFRGAEAWDARYKALEVVRSGALERLERIHHGERADAVDDDVPQQADRRLTRGMGPSTARRITGRRPTPNDGFHGRLGSP